METKKVEKDMIYQGWGEDSILNKVVKLGRSH